METTDIYIYINIYVYLRMRTNVYTYVHVYVRTYSKSVNNSRDPHGCETPQSTDKLATQTHKLISAPTDKPPTSRKACKCNGFVYIRTYVRTFVYTYVRTYVPGSSNIRPGADISHIHPLTDITFFNNVNFFCSITLFCFSAISLFFLHFSL